MPSKPKTKPREYHPDEAHKISCPARYEDGPCNCGRGTRPENPDEPHREVIVPGERVNHPAHYGEGGSTYEAIRVIEAWNLDFHLGNTVKYIRRAGHKDNELEDLQKARWYLDRKIKRLEGPK